MHLRKKSFLFLLGMLMKLNPSQVLATDIPIDIENNHYPFPTKLVCCLKFKEDIMSGFSIEIPAINGEKVSLSNACSVLLRRNAVMVLSLFINEDSETKDCDKTTLASAQFKASVPIHSFKIFIDEQEINVLPFYNSPPKFAELPGGR